MMTRLAALLTVLVTGCAAAVALDAPSGIENDADAGNALLLEASVRSDGASRDAEVVEVSRPREAAAAAEAGAEVVTTPPSTTPREAWKCYAFSNAPTSCALDCFRNLTPIAASVDAGRLDAGPEILTVSPVSCSWPAQCSSFIYQAHGLDGADWCSCWSSPASIPAPPGWIVVATCPPPPGV